MWTHSSGAQHRDVLQDIQLHPWRLTTVGTNGGLTRRNSSSSHWMVRKNACFLTSSASRSLEPKRRSGFLRSSWKKQTEIPVTRTGNRISWGIWMIHQTMLTKTVCYKWDGNALLAMAWWWSVTAQLQEEQCRKLPSLWCCLPPSKQNFITNCCTQAKLTILYKNH
jgi:hypothetical protein